VEPGSREDLRSPDRRGARTVAGPYHPGGLRARHWEGFHRVLAIGESHYGTGDLLSVPGIRKDGQRISLEFTIVPLKDEQGQVHGLAAVMRDVTSRFEEIRSLKKKLAEATAPASPH
jgi:PAS domain S-box-containing protein